MKILLSSHFFYPSIGGLEEVSFILAEQFTRLGHEVKVVTQSADPAGKKFDYEVVRRPGIGDLFRILRWSDVLFHNNVSMRTAWPLFFCHRPWVITHQTWTARADGWVDVFCEWPVICRNQEPLRMEWQQGFAISASLMVLFEEFAFSSMVSR